MVALIPLLTACGAKNSDSSSSSENISTTEETLTKPVSDNGNRDISTSDDLTLARRELYEAGINSADISDTKLKEYIQKAKEKRIDLSQYVKENGIKK